MIKYEKVIVPAVERQSATHKICDKCKKEFVISTDENGWSGDPLETQEFHHINFTGGYGSVFGDGEEVKIDICQDCLFDILTREGLWNLEKQCQ